MRRSAGALALALGVCGCREPTREVTYRLVGSEAGPLPVLLQTSDSCYHLLKSGDVRIRGSQYVSSFGIENACPGKGIEQVTAGARGKVETRRDSLIFHDSTGKVIGRANLTPDTLAVANPLHRLVYIRHQTLNPDSGVTR